VAHLAEALEAGDAEVHRPGRLVGVAPVEDHADEAQDVVDGRAGRRLAEGGQHAEGPHVALEPGHLGPGQLQVRDADLPGLAQHVVVDVGDVAHALGLVAEVAQPALEDVVEHVGRRVPHVGGVVRRDAARVHLHERARLEGDHRLAGGVVQPH
jgi:hypothetical protein